MSDSFKKSAEWDALLNLLRQGQKNSSFQPILWVGAGLSVPAGYPTTNQLIELLKESSVKALPNFAPNDITLPLESVNRSFTLWVQHFAKINGYGRLNKALASIFSKLPTEPTSTHLALINNPWKSIFTTNYDQLLETALDKSEIKFNAVTQDNNNGLEQDGLISLYKIHGGINNIRDWTLDEQSYLNFSDKYPFLDAKLKATLIPHSIVYVGCSMLDPRVIGWYQYCEKNNLSSQLEYSIAIIRKSAWDSLPEGLKILYLNSQIHPLFFESFDELPLLFSDINNKLNNKNIEKVNEEERNTLDAKQIKEREKEILDELLYETVAPSIIDILACIWLEVPSNTQYTEHLKTLGGAKTKNKGEIAFKSLLDDFVELCKKLIGTKLEFEYKERVFLLLDSVLNKYFPTHQTLERIDYNPHALHGSLQVYMTQEEGVYADANISSTFNNILKEFCELIIDCSQALPSWTNENLDSQLNNHELLFGNLREELGRWKENNSNEIDEIVLVEKEFRRAIARRFDELKIFGLSFGKRTRKYQLSVAYISLTTETDFNNSEDNKVMSTNEALTCYERLVILGEAGQGKTTLLQWLTVQCGRRSFGSDQTDFNKKIPVLIQLRSVLNESSLPDELDFYAFMTEGIEIETPHREWIDNILKNKLGIIMIDGFDEVPKERRQQVLDWIDTLCRRYDGNQFILTSRPSAYENTSLEHLDFNVIQLQTMDRKAQSEFIEHWHHAIALEYDKTKPDALCQQGNSLLEKLKHQQVLRNLAQNPLLCGVLCMLHHDRNGYLPKDRTDLYESTCRLFLDSRDREKKVIETNKFTLLDIRNKESFLSDIAFWMTSNGKTTISPDILKQRLEEKSRDMPELWEKISANELELFFLERSGLLVQVGINEIQFTHRTFQEFYTAKYIISENDNDCLSLNAGNDYWNGTIQLAIGLRTSKKENEKYLTELLTKANEFDSNHNSNSAISLYLLVLSCKENMREITPNFSKKLQSVIKKIVPPPTAKVRDAIALAGDIAIPYLTRPNRRRSIVKDHYCALALIKIATPDAYIILREYFKDDRESYTRKLCTDIKKMDSEILKDSNLIEAMLDDGIEGYDQSIRVMLSFLSQESTLVEEGIHQDALLGFERSWKLSQGLVPLAKLDEDNITELDLSHSDISNLSLINKFTKLESINLSNSKIDSFSPLTNLINLKHLNLQNIEIKYLDSLSELKQLSNLRSLRLMHSTLSNVLFLSSLTHLESLELTLNRVIDLSLLGNLTKLKSLHIAGGKVENLNALSSMSELTSLDIRYADIEDIAVIKDLTNLRELNLTHTNIKEICFLENLLFLENLNLSRNEITDISILKNLEKLTDLSLAANDIIEIAALKNLKKLTSLNLSRNEITDISALTDIKELTQLFLTSNNIVDISALKLLTKIKDLTLAYNDVIDITPLSTLNDLKYLDLSDTKIESLDALVKCNKLEILDLSGVGDINIAAIVNHEHLTVLPYIIEK